MWLHIGSRSGRGTLPVAPLRGVVAAVRWCSVAPSSREAEAQSGKPSSDDVLTIKSLHRQAELLARFQPPLIRNFRSDAHSNCMVIVAGSILRPPIIRTILFIMQYNYYVGERYEQLTLSPNATGSCLKDTAFRSQYLVSRSEHITYRRLGYAGLTFTRWLHARSTNKSFSHHALPGLISQ